MQGLPSAVRPIYGRYTCHAVAGWAPLHPIYLQHRTSGPPKEAPAITVSVTADAISARLTSDITDFFDKLKRAHI